MRRVVKFTSFILVILLMGCASQLGEGVSSLPYESNGKEKATDGLKENIEHIEDNSNSDIVFDADVDICDAAKLGELYTADITPVKIEPDAIFKVFKKYIQGDSYEEVTPPGFTEEEKWMKFETIFPIESLVVSSYGILRFSSIYGYAVQSLLKYNEMDLNNNLDSFEQKDLDFMSREEASKYVKEQFNQLGLDVLDECKIYSMTAEELIAEKERYLKESPGDADIMIKEALSIKEWQDVYYMVFNFHFDGVPFIDETFSFESNEGLVASTSAVVLLSEEGFVSLDVNARQAVNKSESSKTILNLREAMDALIKSFELVITPEPMLVTRISVRYMQYKQVSKNIVPAYQFKVMQGDWPMYIYINAFTGERII